MRTNELNREQPCKSHSSVGGVDTRKLRGRCTASWKECEIGAFDLGVERGGIPAFFQGRGTRAAVWSAPNPGWCRRSFPHREATTGRPVSRNGRA